MHPRTEEVLNYLDKTRSELRAAIESIPENLRDTKPAADQWSAAQVVDHLAIAHKLVAALVGKAITEAQATGVGTETATSSLLKTIPTDLIVDRSRKRPAPERILPRDQIDIETAWAEFDQARENLRAAFLTGDGLALEQVVQTHPVLGPINMYQWVLFNGSHEARHTLQVHEIAAALGSVADSTSVDA